MAVHVALEIDRDSTTDYLIFCSQHGEVVRSETLIECIAKGIELSPTDFSLSVHNTAAGTYTNIRNSTLPSTSIASGATTFASGWLEAEAYLFEHRSGRALLVDHDDSIPEPYRPFVPCDRNQYALAMILRASHDDSGVRLDLIAPSVAEEQAAGPHFLSWWLSEQPSLTLSAERQGFRWTR
jgi:hypothetical protein